MPVKGFSAEHHLGSVIFDCLKKRPDAVCQIDAATGESETNGSVLRRTIQLAQSMRKFGLVPGDILALSGQNHMDIHIPHYAGLVNGLPVVGVDPMFKYDEILSIFKLTKPKIAFCDLDKYGDFMEAVKTLGLDTKVIRFGKGAGSMTEFLETYRDDTPVENFVPAVFDQDKIYAWLISTGGTTGILKVAAIKHQALVNKIKSQFIASASRKSNVGDGSQIPNALGLTLSAVQGISGFFLTVSMPMLHLTKLLTSAPPTPEHVIDIINKYKPVITMMFPCLISDLLKSEKACDWTCFKSVVVGGGKLHTNDLLELKKRLHKDAIVEETYAQTENLGTILFPNPFGPLGSCGRPSPNTELKLVDLESGKEITEPHVAGELWTKSDNGFSEYYNNPEETADAFTEDGWFKTGDLLYRDENDNYFFVERIKMLIKYRNYQILPPEIEDIIRSHPEVLDVCVTSIPHEEDIEHTVACVVRRPGAQVTEHDISQLVAEKLSESKRLRGGVIFMDKLPMTTVAGKVARGKLKKIVADILLKQKHTVKTDFKLQENTIFTRL